MIRKIFLAISLVTLSGCANQTVKILDATWVSMKNSTPPGPTDKLTKVGPISEEYCLDKLSGSYGLMDEAVKKAEEKNKIDYIKYPSFTQTVGKSCVQVAGEGFRILR
jgi:hypothetical protein